MAAPLIGLGVGVLLGLRFKVLVLIPVRAAEVLSVLVKNPHFDRWTYLSQKAALRTIMQNGLATRSPDTAARIAEAINHLAAIGDTDYLDLLPTAPPEAA